MAKISKEKEVKEKEVKTYEPSKEYPVGVRLYHNIWDDYGTVTEVGSTSDGIGTISVEFENAGLKKLCTGIDLKI